MKAYTSWECYQRLKNLEKDAGYYEIPVASRLPKELWDAGVDIEDIE